MTAAEAIRLVRRMMAAYPQRDIRPETVEVYSAFMTDLDYAATCEAVAYLCATTKWLPTIAEIRARVTEAAANLGSAADGWLEVHAVKGTHNPRGGASYEVPDWSSNALERTVKAMGGIRAIRNSEDPVGVVRSQFFKLFDGFRNEALTECNVRALAPAAKFPRPVTGGSIDAALTGAIEALAVTKRLAP